MNNFRGESHNRIHALLLLALLVLLSLVVYWDFLTFSHLYLYKDIGSDTVNAFYPAYVHLADYVRTDGWPAWSFSQGMGQNIFPGSLGRPSNLVLMLMGSANLAYGLVYVQVGEILLAGIFFYMYLRMLSFMPMTAIVGALLYAFSGFMILGGTWYVFAVDAVYFALLLYAFERYLRDRVWIYLLIAVVLVAAGMSFNLYLYTLFFLPYSLFRFYVFHGWQPKVWLRFLLTMTGLIALGVGISAVFMFANVQQMMNSPRVLGDVSFFDRLMNTSLLGFEGYVHNITALMRLFSSDLLGTGSEFRGWSNYLEAPMFYCGLLPLLLAPQVFVQLDRKHKIAYALLALVFLVPVIIPFFRYLLWAFAGDYYRLYSAFVALVILLFSLQALNFIFKKGRVHVRLLMATLVVLLLILFSPYFWAAGVMFKLIDTRIILAVTGLLLVYAALVIALGSNRFRPVAQWGLLLVVCVELAGFSWQTVNHREVITAEEFESKTGYNDYSSEVVAAIKQKDPGFYRIDKTYGSGPTAHTSINDAKVQGYFGTSSYHSFNQLNYIRFLDVLEVIDGKSESATRWASGMLNNPLLTSFASVKYVLVKQNSRVQMFKRLGYGLVYKQGGIFVMMNPSYLPFGFTYDSYMNEDDFLSLPVQMRSIALMKTVVVGEQFDEPGFSQIKPFDKKSLEPAYSGELYQGDVKQRRDSFLNISSFDHNHVYGQIELEKPKLLFFTLPFDRGWSATVNGEPAELLQVNIGFSGLLLPAGKHEIELNYHLPYFKTSLGVSIISILILIFIMWRRRNLVEEDIIC